ncbi:MAG: tetratricopeptide repeat protein [Candidatus Rifleibacteriota bacterium]
MKKILIPVFMGILCSPVSATNLKEMVKDMGYTEPALFEQIPEQKKFVAETPFERKHHLQNITEKKQELELNPDDFLEPRVFTKSEPGKMIPFLLKLHKKNPVSPKITRKLAATCLKCGQTREALYWYTQTYQRDRSDHEALWNMAALSYQLKEEEKTARFLKEYAQMDPHSSWGRLARNFLKGRFGGETMNEEFDDQFSRYGDAGKSTDDKKGSRVKTSDKSDKEGILVIEGKRTSLSEFYHDYQEPEVSEAVTLKDTLKGKSEKKSLNEAKLKK